MRRSTARDGRLGDGEPTRDTLRADDRIGGLDPIEPLPRVADHPKRGPVIAREPELVCEAKRTRGASCLGRPGLPSTCISVIREARWRPGSERSVSGIGRASRVLGWIGHDLGSIPA